MDLEQWCRWYKRRGAGRLRIVLMREWDPIGVAGTPEARNEYDGYLGTVAERLRADASRDDVAALLESVRCNRMGLPADREADLRVADALRNWYEAQMSRSE